MTSSDTHEIATRFVDLWRACNGWLTAKGWPTMTIDEFTTFFRTNFASLQPTTAEDPQ